MAAACTRLQRSRKSADRTHRAAPLGLWFLGKVWTLVAWCELRTDFRMFRLDRITTMDDDGKLCRSERGKTLADFYRATEERDQDIP